MIEASGSHTQVSKQRDWQSLSNGYDETVKHNVGLKKDWKGFIYETLII